MLAVDRKIRQAFAARIEEIREMMADPIEAKDAAKTFYWGFEDKMFSEAIRLDLIADDLESRGEASHRFRHEAAEIRAFLADPDGYVRKLDEGETCYCGGEADEAGRCDECGEWLW